MKNKPVVIWECKRGFHGAVRVPFLVIDGRDGIPFPDAETCTLAAAAPKLAIALRDARQALYCYKQNLLEQCREDAAKLQTRRIKEIDDLLEKAGA